MTIIAFILAKLNVIMLSNADNETNIWNKKTLKFCSSGVLSRSLDNVLNAALSVVRLNISLIFLPAPPSVVTLPPTNANGVGPLEDEMFYFGR